MLPTDDMTTLKHCRELAGLGVRELGRKSGVGKDTVSRIERNIIDPAKVCHGDIVRLVHALRQSGLPWVTADSLFPIELDR